MVSSLERVELHDGIAAPADDDDQLLQINTALDGLARESPEKAEVVKLRFFVGLEASEGAGVFGVSTRTVERHWAFAKAWLFDRVRSGRTL